MKNILFIALIISLEFIKITESSESSDISSDSSTVDTTLTESTTVTDISTVDSTATQSTTVTDITTVDSTAIESTTVTDITTVDSNATESTTVNQTIYNNKRSSSGLSSGAIVAIILPCIAALLIVTALVFLFRSKPSAPLQNINNKTIGLSSSSNIV